MPKMISNEELRALLASSAIEDSVLVAIVKDLLACRAWIQKQLNKEHVYQKKIAELTDQITFMADAVDVIERYRDGLCRDQDTQEYETCSNLLAQISDEKRAKRES